MSKWDRLKTGRITWSKERRLQAQQLLGGPQGLGTQGWDGPKKDARTSKLLNVRVIMAYEGKGYLR